MAAPSDPDAIRDVNIRYHDVAAAEYDAKWGIDFHAIGRAQVLGKLRKVLGTDQGGRVPIFGDALEIGAGTGYFTLNLLQAGVIERATATDISPGMLRTLGENARRLDLPVRTEPCDATALPFEDGSFDLVFGHAVLHHLPNLERAFAEFHRVLRPGGTFAFMGEPSRYGDRIAAVPKRGATAAAPLWRALVRAHPTQSNGHAPDDDHELESQVDVHAFAPTDLSRAAAGAGFERIRVRGEELLANWFGWTNRTLETSAEPATVPWLWRQYAYRGYIALQAVDRALLEPRLPAGLFYNLMIAGHRPVD